MAEAFTRVVAVYCCNADGQTLQVWHPKHGWGMPSGKIEPGEMPGEAARRELYEETGLRCDGGLTLMPPHVAIDRYETYLYRARAYDLVGDMRPEVRPDGPRPVRWGPPHEMHYIALASITQALRDA